VRGADSIKHLYFYHLISPFLLLTGVEALEFTKSKAEALEVLISKGQRTLHYLNAREVAFAGLVERKRRAVRLLERQKEAIIFLAKAPMGLWNTQEKIKNTQVLYCICAVNCGRKYCAIVCSVTYRLYNAYISHRSGWLHAGRERRTTSSAVPVPPKPFRYV